MSNEISTEPLATLRGPTVAAAWTRIPVDALRSANVDPAPLLRSAGLTSDMLQGARARVPAQADTIVWLGAAKLLAMPSFGTYAIEHHVADDSLGISSLVALSASTLAEALRDGVRFHRSAKTNGTVRFVEDAVGAVLVSMPGPREPAWPAVIAEAALAAPLELARRFTGRRVTPNEVWFQHPRPPNYEACARYFGAPLRFGRPDNRLIFAPEVLRLPLRTARESVHDYLCDVAAAELASMPDVTRFSDRVRAAISASFGVEQPRVQSAAAALGMSARTVQRRLAEENISFQDVLDSVRTTEAKRMLASGTHDVSTVARHLGFASAASFRQAFKRWTGTSLRMHRRSMAEESQ